MEVKNFKITGEYKEQKRLFKFTKYIRALDEKKAKEKLFSTLNLGKARSQIQIKKIKEISSQEIANDTLKKLSINKKPTILGRE